MTNFTLWNTDVDLDFDNVPNEDEIKTMDDMLGNPTHGFFRDDLGNQLHYIQFLPPDEVKVKGVCIFQHGIHAHAGLGFKAEDGSFVKMALLSRKLTSQGYVLYSLDMLGHGLSEGVRFYIPGGDWTINRDGLSSFAKFALSNHDNGIPFFLAGESYGGCLAIHVSKLWQNNPADAPSNFKGVALIAPAIIGDLPPKVVVYTLRYCLAPIFPKWTPFFMPHPVSAERIWSDEKIRAEFTSEKNDRMGLSAAGKPFRLGTAVALLQALESVREESIPGLNVPFCVMHGTDDYAVPISGTDYLLEKATTPASDRSVLKIEGAYHDLLSEPSRDSNVDFLVKWMDNKCV